MSRRRSPEAAPPAFFPCCGSSPFLSCEPLHSTARGHSSAGRALQWHCRGHRFDPGWLHQQRQGLSQRWLSPFDYLGYHMATTRIRGAAQFWRQSVAVSGRRLADPPHDRYPAYDQGRAGGRWLKRSTAGFSLKPKWLNAKVGAGAGTGYGSAICCGRIVSERLSGASAVTGRWRFPGSHQAAAMRARLAALDMTAGCLDCRLDDGGVLRNRLGQRTRSESGFGIGPIFAGRRGAQQADRGGMDSHQETVGRRQFHEFARNPERVRGR